MGTCFGRFPKVALAEGSRLYAPAPAHWPWRYGAFAAVAAGAGAHAGHGVALAVPVAPRLMVTSTVPPVPPVGFAKVMLPPPPETGPPPLVLVLVDPGHISKCKVRGADRGAVIPVRCAATACRSSTPPGLARRAPAAPTRVRSETASGRSEIRCRNQTRCCQTPPLSWSQWCRCRPLQLRWCPVRRWCW